MLLRTHWNKQLRQGWRGYIAIMALVALALRVVAAAVVKAAVRSGIALPFGLVCTSAVSLRYRQNAVALCALLGAVGAVAQSRDVGDVDDDELPQGGASELRTPSAGATGQAAGEEAAAAEGAAAEPGSASALVPA